MARILFIDDDPITLEILGKAAQILGHAPTLANQARPAIQTAADQQPDLIMMDMMMPDMDGLDVLACLRAQPSTSQIPVVILSAGATPDDAQLVMQAGAQEYLTKPVSLAVLVETIKKYTAPK
jgi:two-component system sensor histidine kinase RpfC